PRGEFRSGQQHGGLCAPNWPHGARWGERIRHHLHDQSGCSQSERHCGGNGAHQP
ncbi:unnamed protein product, partial [Effrenium voratum]